MIQNTLTAVGTGDNGQLYVCTVEGCGHETFWTFEDVRGKGEPVCPNDDTDLVQACDGCGYPKENCDCDEFCTKCGKAGSFPDSICTTCANERGL
ncbi:MAG: hypothetical protein KJI69_05295 [Patescibacteria group bacterium]|nr:hypothetical protein [Patescibacteria group bacterium]